MSHPIPSPRWCRFLLVLNAAVPVPAITLLAMRHEYAGWFFAFTLSVHGLLLWGILYPRSRWLGALTDRFRTEEKAVWLTLDDGPDGERTRELSSALRARGVRATFFVIGTRLKAQPEMAALLQSDGHTLANHSATHPRETLWCSPRSRVVREVDGGFAALREARVETKWFRPPVGHKPPALAPVLLERGARLIAWTVGGRDGWSESTDATVARVLKHARPGAIIVLHEGRAYSLPTILAVVDALLAEGYRFVIPTDAMLD